MEARSFEFSGGALGLDFVNTVGDRPVANNDLLRGYPDLVAWAQQADLIDRSESESLLETATRHPRSAAGAFRSAVELRECVYRLFLAVANDTEPNEDDLASFNREMSKALPHLRLASTDGDLRWTWADAEGILDRMLWPVLRSSADLLTSDLCVSVRQCEARTCSWLFIDRSRGRRRRWCDMASCGNRAKARRHYARKKAVRER